jgi:hypothetical protein
MSAFDTAMKHLRDSDLSKEYLADTFAMLAESLKAGDVPQVALTLGFLADVEVAEGDLVPTLTLSVSKV